MAGPRPLAVRAGVVLVRVASCRGPVRWAVTAVSSHSTASWSEEERVVGVQLVRPC